MIKRGNFVFVTRSSISIPWYEGVLITRVNLKAVKEKLILLEEAEDGKHFLLFICEHFVRISRVSPDVIVIHDYCYKDKLERLVSIVPVPTDGNIRYVEIMKAEEGSPKQEYATYIFKNKYCFFDGLDLDSVEEILAAYPEECDDMMT